MSPTTSTLQRKSNALFKGKTPTLDESMYPSHRIEQQIKTKIIEYPYAI